MTRGWGQDSWGEIERPALEVEEVLARHPCFGSAPSHAGRIHLPVAPTCNLRCRFCARGISKTREVPGVAQRLLAPEQAPRVVGRALAVCPEITVVGVAGPGDGLASEHALRALRLVHESHPGLIKCLSTNGLRLADRVDDIVAAGVRTLTVTINAVDPALVPELVGSLVYRGRRYDGEAAGRVLIENQLTGLMLAATRGLIIKVNTVLVPGVNDEHIPEVARAVALAGAGRINVIPLIPQHQLADRRAPTCEELHDVREAAERFLPVFRHCRQCRADAVGRLDGPDHRAEIFGELEIEATFSHG